MKSIIVVLLIIMMRTMAAAQTDEAAQLLLNVEKLAQFKQILSDLKKGYEVVSKGYNTVKSISEGNFSLHKTFLDALMEVSPGVKKYKRIGDIISNQILLVKEYKAASIRFKSNNLFSVSELNYIENVYGKLIDESLRNLDELTLIVTSKKLRMNDEERLKAIDQIYDDMQNKLSFLRSFNGSTKVVAAQRAREIEESITMKRLNGIK